MTMKSQSLPRFLIVTPSYNQARFINETLDSVFSQHGNFEINYVVMDGGSSDGTVQIVEKLKTKSQKNIHFTFESKKDQGQSDAINKGIRYFQKLQNFPARGWSALGGKNQRESREIYFAYINSDDYYLPGAFEKVAQAFDRDPEKMWLVGECQIVDHAGHPIQSLIRWYKRLWRGLLSVWPSTLYILNPIPQPAVFIRWEAVQKVGLFEANLKYVMDYQYWLKLKQWYGLPLSVKTTLAAFRIHGQSKGGQQYHQQFDEELAVAESFNQNYLILGLHRFHNWLIRSVYDLIK